jgi:hypothetical protein
MLSRRFEALSVAPNRHTLYNAHSAEMIVTLTVFLSAAFPMEEMHARWRPAVPAGSFLSSASGHNSRY